MAERCFYFAVRDPAEEVVVAIVNAIFDREPDQRGDFTWRHGLESFPDSVAKVMDLKEYEIDQGTLRKSEALTLEAMGVCPIIDVREYPLPIRL